MCSSGNLQRRDTTSPRWSRRTHLQRAKRASSMQNTNSLPGTLRSLQIFPRSHTLEIDGRALFDRRKRAQATATCLLIMDHFVSPYSANIILTLDPPFTLVSSWTTRMEIITSAYRRFLLCKYSVRWNARTFRRFIFASTLGLL